MAEAATGDERHVVRTAGDQGHAVRTAGDQGHAVRTAGEQGHVVRTAGEQGHAVRAAGDERHVVRAVGDEAHVVWAVQARPDGRPGPGVRVYRAGAAVAVASPALSGRDRIAVAGPADDALPLVRQALREAGPAYRPFGDAALIAALARAIPGLEAGPPFCWMETSRVPDRPTQAVRWLDSAGQREACALFDRHFPGSYAQPGRPGVHRWAGAHDEAGRLLAVAADAWSAPGCGFLAGVVTDPRARGRGLASAVSRFVTAALVRHRGRAALMVDEDNAPAIAVYERTGMTRRRFAAAGLTRRASPPG